MSEIINKEHKDYLQLSQEVQAIARDLERAYDNLLILHTHGEIVDWGGFDYDIKRERKKAAKKIRQVQRKYSHLYTKAD